MARIIASRRAIRHIDAMTPRRDIVVETPRLILRPWEPEEREILRAILSDPETMKHWPAPFSEEDISSWHEWAISLWAEQRLGRLAVVLKVNDTVIGDAGLVPKEMDGRAVTDLGYLFHRDYHGQGFATEAAGALLKHGLGRGLSNIVCNMAQDHPASRRVAEKIGMVKAWTFVNDWNLGKTHDVYVPVSGVGNVGPA